MAIVQSYLDRLTELQAGKAPWTKHYFDIARYTLPDAERFDSAFASPGSAIDAVVSTNIAGGPVASERGREIYDQTSLWAVDRGAAGTLSLVMPQDETWFDLVSADPFAGEPDDEQKRWLEAVRDYQFATRANPRSGYWTSRKAAMRALWAFGTAVRFIEEHTKGGIQSPISYRYTPLSECFLGTDFEGNIDTNYRVFTRSARQCVERWGDSCSPKTKQMAADEKRKDQNVTILHAVAPRLEKGGLSNSNRDSAFVSCYIEIAEKHLLGESGFFEFPYIVDHWQRNNPGPYAEGPVALAIADIKSTNMLAKEELKAIQQWVAPPTATMDDSGNRLNLNPRMNNPGYLGAAGELLVKPIVTMQRPDFARAVIEARQKQTRTTLYLELWTAILDSQRQMTAEEVFVKNQERADQLGPVGSSIQTGASFEVDREIAILERRGAFRPGSPLAAPESAQGKRIGVRFTSRLDRLRKSGELQGLQQLWTFAGNIAQAGKPEALEKLDADESIDFAQQVLGAPRKVMTKPDKLALMREARQNAEAAANGINVAQGAGDAAQSAASGAEAIAGSPAASDILRRIAGVAGVAA